MNELDQWFDNLPSDRRVLVAFSGGVDSSVVAASAFQIFKNLAMAVTARSPSVAAWQLTTAQTVAGEIGIEHQFVDTTETSLPDYIRNDRRRCFYCKQTLYQSLATIAEHYPRAMIVSGTNADDLGDVRPGIDAGRRAGIYTPLADLGINKSGVRALAKHYGLSNAELPASPCLASRIAYGTEVTPQRLAAVEAAEAILRDGGFAVCRVRMLSDNHELVASIEVELDQIRQLKSWMSEHLVGDKICDAGFDRVVVDAEGFRSGKLNDAMEPIMVDLRLADHLR